MEDWGFDGLDIDYEHWAGGPEGYGEGDKEKVALLENFYKELRTELPQKANCSLPPAEPPAALSGMEWGLGKP